MVDAAGPSPRAVLWGRCVDEERLIGGHIGQRPCRSVEKTHASDPQTRARGRLDPRGRRETRQKRLVV